MIKMVLMFFLIFGILASMVGGMICAVKTGGIFDVPFRPLWLLAALICMTLAIFLAENFTTF